MKKYLFSCTKKCLCKDLITEFANEFMKKLLEEKYMILDVQQQQLKGPF